MSTPTNRLLFGDAQAILMSAEETKHPFILVVCREEGDDEDSTYTYQNITRKQALSNAERECMVYPLSNEFYVNGVFSSTSPIEAI